MIKNNTIYLLILLYCSSGLIYSQEHKSCTIPECSCSVMCCVLGSLCCMSSIGAPIVIGNLINPAMGFMCAAGWYVWGPLCSIACCSFYLAEDQNRKRFQSITSDSTTP